ncbi:MAG TPA: hypothetical protein VHP37_26575 [Burkholderiales bacterium]|nr:hypothetical protein [Burkholderiales bacterium]
MTPLVRVLDALAACVLALAIAASLARPLFYWDSWAYHLPFSALLLDIGGARTHFVLSQEMQWRYEGFPLAAELIQGVLWKAAGTINATALINSAAFGALCIVAARALRASLAVLVFGALAVPLVAMHVVSAYIDLFVAACIVFQALAAVKMEAAARRDDPRLLVWCCVYVASAALAGNSKVTGLLLSGAIGAFTVGYIAIWSFPRRRESISAPPDRWRWRPALLALALGAVLAGASAFRNVVEHGNPAYPLARTVAGYDLPGPEPDWPSAPPYTSALGPAARPVNWLVSITEIDWKLRGIEPRLTLDMHSEAETTDGLPARTGGFWAPLVIASIALAVWLAARASRRDRTGFRERRFLLWLFVFVTIATAFMPQSHELRYWLHWPLMLALVVAALARSALGPRGLAALAAAYFVALLVTQYRVDWTLKPWPVITQADAVAGQTGASSVDAVRAHAPVCLGPDFNPRQIAYSAIFQGGSYVVEQGWTKCERYPAYRP